MAWRRQPCNDRWVSNQSSRGSRIYQIEVLHVYGDFRGEIDKKTIDHRTVDAAMPLHLRSPEDAVHKRESPRQQ